MSRTIRTIAAFAVFILLAGHAIQAAPLGFSTPFASERGFFSAVWVWEWIGAHLLTNTKAGCGMDPNGIPMCKEGLGMDPNGQNAAPNTGEAGLGMDPDGHH